jgi:hypothetical protein
MVYFLPNEFMAPANQVVQEEASLDDEQLGGLMAQLVLAKQAVFDKPAKNLHMRPLYLKGYVNGKPLTKMCCRWWSGGQCNAVHHFQKTWYGPWRLDTYKHNTERFRQESCRYQGMRPRGSNDRVQNTAHNLLCHRR